jgi:hypothetical protein
VEGPRLGDMQTALTGKFSQASGVTVTKRERAATMDLKRQPSSCSCCGKWDEHLQDCGGCGAVSCCNKQCQHEDWKKHKKVCVRNMRGATECKDGDTKMSTGEGQSGTICSIPLRALIPRDIKDKCDFLDAREKMARAGNAVFGRVIQADEPGWADQSVTLPLDLMETSIDKVSFELLVGAKTERHGLHLFLLD